MREGLINIPHFDNHGNSLSVLVEIAMEILAKQFGGATAIEAKGFWIGPDGKHYIEPITQLVTAYDPSCSMSDAYLRGVAQSIGSQAGQLAMYIRYANGEVEIIDTAKEQRFA